MKCVMAIVGFLAILALASGTALGIPYTGGVEFDNTANTSTNPHATTNGLVWIDSGSGPALLNEDINMQLLCGGLPSTLAPLTNIGYDGRPTVTGPQYSTFLLSDLTATAGFPPNTGNGDGTFFGGGLFLDPYGIEWATYQTPTRTNVTEFYFQLSAWTGNYNTYAAAYAASASGTPGVYVGQTPVFVNGTATGMGIPPDLTNMPALVLAKAVPEPSALLLAATGSFGLLAYAWRKQR